MKKYLLAVALISLMPGLAAADTCASPVSSVACLARKIADLFGVATAILVGIAIVIYFAGIAYNMFGYSHSGSTQSFEKFRQTIMWGITILFVIFSIWGIIRLLGSALFNTSNFNSLF